MSLDRDGPPAVLAYLFWHRPDPAAPRDRYEARLVAFHQVLAEAPPTGFLASATYRLEAVPWLGDEVGYEDWYLVETWAALGSLNEGAVRAATGAAHDAVASLTGTGTGGLYRLVVGRPRARAAAAAWLGRPRGTRFELVLERLCREAGPEASAWRRQLALGPAPELVLLHPPDARVSAPAGWSLQALRRQALWLGPTWDTAPA